MQDCRNLKVWRKAHRLALGVYAATAAFRRHETFGVTAQMRRAAVSVAANIAEGAGRAGDREFARFLHVSVGSASELEYHLLLASDLKMLGQAESLRLARDAAEVKRMLAGLISALAPTPRVRGAGGRSPGTVGPTRQG